MSSESRLEGNSGTSNLTFTITLDPATDETVTVNYATADGSAVAPGDFTATSGTLVFLPNQTNRTVIVPLVSDLAPEEHESFELILSNPVNAQIGLMDGNTFCTTLEPKLFTIDCE